MKALRSKTIIFSMLLAMLGALELNIPMLQTALGDYYALTYIIIGMIIAALRVVTKVPLSDK